METQAQQVNQYDLAKFDQVAADIKRIEEEGNFLPDCSTPKGYEVSKRFVLDTTTPARRLLDQAHKETKAPFWATCKDLDKRKKELSVAILAVEAPHMEAYKAADKAKSDAKLAQQKAIQDRINLLSEWVDAVFDVNLSSQEIDVFYDKCINYEEGMSEVFFGERLGEVEYAHKNALKKIADRLNQQIGIERAVEEQEKRDAQAEKDRIAKEEAEKKLAAAQKLIDDKKAEEEIQAQLVEKERLYKLEIERIKIENANNLRIEKEAQEMSLKEEQKRIKEAEERANRETIAAKEKAEQDAKDAAEAARLAQIKKQNDDIESERLATEAREKNKAHISKTMRAAKEALMAAGLDEKTAKVVVLAIHNKKVPNVSINY